MFKHLGNIFENHLFQASMALAGFGGLLSDAYLGMYGFWITLLIALVLLSWSVVDEYRMRKFYTNEVLPIPIVISVDDPKPLNAIYLSITKEIEKDKRFKDIEKKLNRYFNISRNDLLFQYNGSMYDNERLISFLQIIRYSLNAIERRFDNKVQFHIAYLKRPAIGFAVGSMFRSDGIVVYQNNDFQDRFDRVATISSRQYKEQITEYKKFSLVKNISNPQNKSILLVIQLASHNVSYDHDTFKDFENKVILKSLGNGTIGMDEDWVLYAQEIYNTINNLHLEYSDITIAHSMPEAVAIIVGMALENYWNINITQFDQGDYKTVINLQSIHYYF